MNTISQLNYKRSGWIDLIRGVLMCLVFLYLFTSDWDSISIKKKWMQVLRGILCPYFLFMITFLLPKIIFLHYDWKLAIQDIYLLRASWFVIAIGVLQLMYAIPMKYFKKNSSFIIMSIFYGLIGYFFILLYRNLPFWFKENPLLYSKAMPGCLPACINLAFLAAPFFSLGILYRKFEKQFRVNENLFIGIILFFAYLCIVINDHNTLNSYLVFASCASNNFLIYILYFIIVMISLIMICKKIDIIKPLNFIGKNSLLFYYFNIAMLRITGTIYDKGLSLMDLDNIKTILGYGNYILVTILAIIVTFPIVWFIDNNIPILSGKREAYDKLSKRLNIKINL